MFHAFTGQDDVPPVTVTIDNPNYMCLGFTNYNSLDDVIKKQHMFERFAVTWRC